jgi:hypothetical protein
MKLTCLMRKSTAMKEKTSQKTKLKTAKKGKKE